MSNIARITRDGCYFVTHETLIQFNSLWMKFEIFVPTRAKTTTRAVINKLVYEEKMITNKQDITGTMNKHFCDIAVRLQSELRDYGNRFMEYLSSRISDSFYIAPTCKDHAHLEIKKMNAMKAPGHDSIGTKIMHFYPEIFAENLSMIHRNGILKGVYHNAGKIMKVITVFKSRIKANPNNYRPISLLSHFDIVFEIILCKRIVAFLEHKQISYCHRGVWISKMVFYSNSADWDHIHYQGFSWWKICNWYIHWFQEGL